MFDNVVDHEVKNRNTMQDITIDISCNTSVRQDIK